MRNTETWVEAITSAMSVDANGPLAALGILPAQAPADGQALRRLVTERQSTPQASGVLVAIHRRYLHAATPAKGETMSLGYWLRLFRLDRWNRWHRLTRYRSWQGSDGETLDGTNIACDRAIGW